VLGAFYHAKAFPETWSPKNNDIKAIRTRSGHTIEFHDTEGEEEVWLYDYNKENYFIKLKTHAKEITIEAIEHIELKAKNISILAEKDLKLEATDATTKAGGNISTEASGNISSKASGNMSNEASANMKIKGGANTTIEAGAKLEEKAAIVKLN
jgi:type VI secretion system secreted protein VgrG